MNAPLTHDSLYSLAEQYSDECCCKDRYDERKGYDTLNKPKKQRPYRNYSDWCRMVAESSDMHGECSITKTLAPVMKELVVGTDTTFEIKPREDNANQIDQATVDAFKSEMELLTDPESKFCDVPAEIVGRINRDGMKMCMVDASDSERGMYFLDSCLIGPPDLDEEIEDRYDDDLWKYGAVADTAGRRIQGYWLRGLAGEEQDKQSTLDLEEEAEEYGYVPLEDMIVEMRGVDIGDPLGVPITNGLFKSGLHHADLMDCCYKFLKVQMRTAVWEQVAAPAREKVMQKALGELKKIGIEPDFNPDDPGVYKTKNKEIHNMTVSSVQEILNKINFIRTTHANQWGLPGWVATGDISAGNQHNMEQSLKWTVVRLRSQRKIVNRALLRTVWRVVASRTGIGEEALREFKRAYRLCANYPELSIENVNDRLQAMKCKLDRNVISLKQARRENDYDPQQMEDEIEEERNVDSGLTVPSRLLGDGEESTDETDQPSDQ